MADLKSDKSERVKAAKADRDRVQYERFVEVARALGADKATPKMDGIVKRAVLPDRAKRKRKS